MIDLHAHVLPGIDDGPTTMEGALDLLRLLESEGVERVCATPHVQPAYPTTAARRDERLAEVRSAAAHAGLAIVIEPGGEIDLEYAATWSDEEIDRFSLAGGRAVLVEFPWTGTWPIALPPTCRALRLRGYLPIIAHPERVRAVQQDPARLDEAIAAGAVTQITAGSIAGRFGDTAQRVALDLIRSRRGHFIATDTHSTGTRPPDLVACRTILREAVGATLADALEAAPADVLAGHVPRLPEPDPPPRRRRLWQ